MEQNELLTPEDFFDKYMRVDKDYHLPAWVQGLASRYADYFHKATPPSGDNLRWVRLTTEDTLPPDIPGRRYVCRFQFTNKLGEPGAIIVYYFSRKEIEEESQGADWFEWLEEVSAVEDETEENFQDKKIRLASEKIDVLLKQGDETITAFKAGLKSTKLDAIKFSEWIQDQWYEWNQPQRKWSTCRAGMAQNQTTAQLYDLYTESLIK
jgi:hypothetical protein